MKAQESALKQASQEILLLVLRILHFEKKFLQGIIFLGIADFLPISVIFKFQLPVYYQA